VKGRLASEIGATAAARFYRALLADQIRRLAHDRRWTLWLFVTPERDIAHPVWRSVLRLKTKGQGQGDLGARMKRPFRVLPPGPIVLVGSDIPLMRPHHIWRAFRLLDQHDLVFGPASDGGFWLIGGRRLRPLPARLFDGVRWSTVQTFAETLG